MRKSCVLHVSEVRNWTEEQCKSSLKSLIDDTAIALQSAAVVLKVMIEKKYDTSKLPKTWVRAMLKIADGEMLPEVMRDFDGAARRHVSKMPIRIQRQLCEDSSIKVLTPYGYVKEEKIQNLSMREISLALDYSGPRTIEQQQQIVSTNDEAPERNEPKRGTFEDAILYFQASKERFGHLKELASLYSMVDILEMRMRKSEK